MTLSNGNIFRVTGHLCGKFSGPRWIPPHKGQWRGALMFSLICVWINGWVNNLEAGDLRRCRAHYDVTVMCCEIFGDQTAASHYTIQCLQRFMTPYNFPCVFNQACSWIKWTRYIYICICTYFGNYCYINPQTPGNAWVRSQHCGYWCAGAKAPGHQYPQCWLNIHCIGPISYKNIAHKVNSIRKWNHILIKMSFKGHLKVI